MKTIKKKSFVTEIDFDDEGRMIVEVDGKEYKIEDMTLDMISYKTNNFRIIEMGGYKVKVVYL